uniref:Uncharacterized protein n=4 Tax=Oryza TaxID=4527 RepID=A0A0E0AWV7_9ORYZ
MPLMLVLPSFPCRVVCSSFAVWRIWRGTQGRTWRGGGAAAAEGEGRWRSGRRRSKFWANGRKAPARLRRCHACMRAACGLPCAGALRCLWLPALRPHAKLCAYASSGNGMALSMAARGALNGGRLELSCNHLYMPAHACRKREYCESDWNKVRNFLCCLNGFVI